jgi:hypothetical protein
VEQGNKQLEQMNKRLFTTLSLLAITVSTHALPLGAPTAVHTQPDSSAAVIRVLPHGTEPQHADLSTQAGTPAGWMAIKVPGPFEAYVQNKDIDKGLHIKPGTSIHLEPMANSGVLSLMEAGDKTSITGLHGKWTQVKLDKAVTGYIQANAKHIDPISSTVLVDMENTAMTNQTQVANDPASIFGKGPYVVIPTEPSPDLSQTGASSLPRLFQGKFVTTRRPFSPRRPHDWQLNDPAGVRYAYLDVSKIMQTTQIEDFANREVVVYGAPKSMADGKNIVIQVDNMRLK